jgi:hypothetical protein
MAMTTAHIGIAQSGPQPVARSAAHPGFADGLVGLIVIGALTCVGGATAPAVAIALVIVTTGGSWTVATQVASQALPFLAITVPATAVWLLGAVQTRRTIRRLAVLHDLADRAAFAELNTLLARE